MLDLIGWYVTLSSHGTFARSTSTSCGTISAITLMIAHRCSSLNPAAFRALTASLYTLSLDFIVHLFGLEKEFWPRSDGALNQMSIGSFKFMRGDRKRMSDKTPVYGKQPEAFLLGLDKQQLIKRVLVAKWRLERPGAARIRRSESGKFPGLSMKSNR